MPAPNQPFKQLRRRIQDQGYQDMDFAEKMGRSRAWLSNRLAGKTPWTMREALQACRILEIRPEEMYNYFKDAEKERVA